MAVVAVLSSQRWQLFFSSIADLPAACQPAGEFIMAVVTVLSSQQWQLFFSSMADMHAARQPAGKLIMAVVAVLSLQQWQLFFSSMADMPAALSPQESSSSWQFWLFSPRSNGSCSSAAWQICLLLVRTQESSIMEVVAVLSSECMQLFFSSMEGMFAACQNAGEFIMAVVAVLSSQQCQLHFRTQESSLWQL
jgi:hypothetical protein